MPNRDKLIQRFEAGEYLASLRNEKGLSLVITSKQLGISPTYLNEIEKGKKVPADELLRGIANYYDIPETDLFQRFGKIPLLVNELLVDVPELQKVLARVEADRKLTREEKFDFAEEIERVYMRYIRGKK
jgi:transcriptional regulator with XRE-family HTH domain